MHGQFFIASGWCAERHTPYVLIVGFRGSGKPLIPWSSLYPEITEIGSVFRMRLTSDGEVSVNGDQPVHSALEVEEGIGYTPTIKAPSGAFRPLDEEVFEKLVRNGKLRQMAIEVEGRTPLIVQWLERFGVMLPDGEVTAVGVA